MSEKIIQETDRPRTRQSLASDLRNLGLSSGMTVIVHSSLSALGWVCGGAPAVIQALMDVVTPDGTIVMPTQTAHYSDPALWENPPVPKSWWEEIRASLPAYDPQVTPAIGMGAIPEVFRRFPSVVRSQHPNVSFAAWGKGAAEMMSHHPLAFGFSSESPLGRIYEQDGFVLLLGADYDSNTSFHLAEHKKLEQKTIQRAAPMLENGERVWKSYQDLDYDSEPFQDIGQAFEKAHQIKVGKVGSASSKLFRQREAVDFAAAWFQQKQQ